MIFAKFTNGSWHFKGAEPYSFKLNSDLDDRIKELIGENRNNGIVLNDEYIYMQGLRYLGDQGFTPASDTLFSRAKEGVDIEG